MAPDGVKGYACGDWEGLALETEAGLVQPPTSPPVPGDHDDSDMGLPAPVSCQASAAGEASAAGDVGHEDPHFQAVVLHRLDSLLSKVEALLAQSSCVQGGGGGAAQASSALPALTPPTQSSAGCVAEEDLPAPAMPSSGEHTLAVPQRQDTKRSTRGTSEFAYTGRVFTVRDQLQDAIMEDYTSLSLERSRTYDDFLVHALSGNQTVSNSCLDYAGPPRWVLRPSCTKRLAWDVCGMCLIGYDLLTIPVQLAFQPRTTPFFETMFWIAWVFWMCDMLLTFATGYYLRGAEVLCPRRIAWHYFKTWLMFDLLVIASDFVAYFGDEGRAPAMARMGKSLRVVRVMRSLRLLRLVKLQKLIETIMDHIDSEHFHISIGMAKGILFVLGMNHIIACMWYGLGVSTTEGVNSWIINANFDTEPSFAFKYLTSLHWSLTQFTPASMEVIPRNIHERLFAVCVLIFALLVFSSFLSSITASMTQLRQLSYKFDKNLSMLRKYLRTYGISQTLSVRILRYVEYRLENKSSEVRESDVSLLNILSSQLQMELVQETYEPMLTQHAFFSQFALASSSAMRELCNKGTSRASYSVGDVAFTERSKSEHMIFVTKGRLQYFSMFRNKKGMCKGDSIVQVGEWCTEATLWTEWEHVGWMQALENSEVLLVSAPKLIEVVRKYARVSQGSLQYGVSFVSWLNEASGQGCLSDLHCLEPVLLERFVTEAFAVEMQAPDPGILSTQPTAASLFRRFRSALTTDFSNAMSGSRMWSSEEVPKQPLEPPGGGGGGCSSAPAARFSLGGASGSPAARLSAGGGGPPPPPQPWPEPADEADGSEVSVALSTPSVHPRVSL